MKIKILAFIAVLILQTSVSAQSYEKIADDTFMFLKAGTFAKPSVSKNTTKMALAQVRVHFKVATTEMNMKKGTSARVTAYLETDVTERDLQALTDEFYRNLQQKLGALGIEFVGWDKIQAAEYYKDRITAAEENKRSNSDLKNGQAWFSFSAQGGPTFMRFNPGDGTMEIVAYGKYKKIKKFVEEVGADLATFDVVIDFAAIDIGVSSGSGSKYVLGGTKTTSYQKADWSVAPIMMVNMANVSMFDEKNKFDGFAVKAPIVSDIVFAPKPYEDPNRTALTTQRIFGTTFTATPVVIESKRDRYLAAARQVLNNYADLFVEKIRLIRGGVKPQNNQNAEKPKDNTTLQQVNSEARQNNQTTAVTTNEMTEAALQAEREGKYQLAADYYGELIKKNPEDFRYYLQRGVVYQNHLKDYKSAIKDFDQALKLNANEPTLYYNRGSAYLQMKEWKKAKADFDKAISLRPELVVAYLNRGIALLNMKKDDEAMADFNAGLRLNPRLPNLYRARAALFKIQGKNELAQADELRAAQLERGQ